MTSEKILDDLCDRYPLKGIRQDIWEAYDALARCFEQNGRLFICGNGGSAADALHIVGELMKSFVLPRPVQPEFARDLQQLCPDDAPYMLKRLQGALPAYALVENTALTSAFGNDVGADMAFAQQVYGYARRGDALLCISTSGNARNVVNAIRVAKAMGVVTVALTGGDGGAVAELCDCALIMSESKTYRIQELHLPVYHALCMMLEQHFFGRAEA